MRNVLLLKIYESSLHINPSFLFLSSIWPKSRNLYTPQHLLQKPTVYMVVGGGRGNCQQPALYTYVTWPLFAYFCLALSLSCWPKTHQASFPILRSAHLTHLHRKYMGRGYAAILNIGLTSMSDQLSQPDLLYTHKINPV